MQQPGKRSNGMVGMDGVVVMVVAVARMRVMLFFIEHVTTE